MTTEEKKVSNSIAQSDCPKWADDFPVDVDRDTHVARRDFIRFLFLVSLGLFTGTIGVFIKSLWHRIYPIKEFRILSAEDIEVGTSYVFNLPQNQGPAILIRLSTDDYVAYSQKCTHLQCPVIWKKSESKLLCPCHHGAFNVKTGDVLYGPPERPLPRIKLDVRAEGIFFTGIEEL